MDTVLGVFMCILFTINLLFVFLHIFGRTRLWLTAMKFATDTPRGKKRKTTDDWLKLNNVTNDYYSKYDHYVSLLSTFMLLLNLIISILIFIYETSFIIDTDDNPIHFNINQCQIYIRAIGILFLISKISQYSFISSLIYNATRDSFFEPETKKLLKILWTILFLVTIYLIAIDLQFNSATITSTKFDHDKNNSFCIFQPPLILWISFIFIDIGISIFLLYLLIKPLYIAAAEVHERMTSLRDDPLHQLMWKYITLVSPMAISTFIIIMFNGFDNFKLSFSYFLVLLISITNICTYYLFRKTERLIRCCFKCLDCWIKCNDLCCCCCQCYTKWLKQDIEFSNAAHEFSNSISQEPRNGPVSVSDENILPSDDDQPLSVKDEGSQTPSTTKSLQKPKSMEYPPNLALHMRHKSSTYSTRNLMSHNLAKNKNRMKRQKSGRTPTDNNGVPAVEHTRQLSITTHAQLKKDHTSTSYREVDFADTEEEEIKRQITDPEIIESQESLSARKTAHIKHLSSQIFETLHEKTKSNYDRNLENYLCDSIGNKYDKHQYLDHQTSLTEEKNKNNDNNDDDNNRSGVVYKENNNDTLTPKTKGVQILSSLLTPSDDDDDDDNEDKKAEKKEDIDSNDLALQLGDSEIDAILDDIDDDEEYKKNKYEQDKLIINDDYYDTDDGEENNDDNTLKLQDQTTMIINSSNESNNDHD